MRTESVIVGRTGLADIGEQWAQKFNRAQEAVLGTLKTFDIEVMDIEGDLLTVREAGNIQQAINQANQKLTDYTLNITEASPGHGQIGLELVKN